MHPFSSKSFSSFRLERYIYVLQRFNRLYNNYTKKVKYTHEKKTAPLGDDGRNEVSRSRSRSLHSKPKKKSDSSTKIYQTDGGLQFEKIMDGDIRLGRTIIDARSGKSKNDAMVLEGSRLIRDALLLGAEAKCIYFSDSKVLDKLPIEYLKDINLFKILYRDLKTWSDTTTPSGILGVFKKPQQGEISFERSYQLPITVILDSLKDPGNAGTIIRTAAAIGCEKVIATRGTVNLWQEKVLRSAMSGHFSIPLYWGISWSEMDNYIDEDANVLLADSHGGKTLNRIFDDPINLTDAHDITVNNESDVSDDEDFDEEMRQQIIEEKKDERDQQKESSVYDFHRVPMAVREYTDDFLLPATDSTKDMHSVALVLGGETDGISAQAKKFAFDHFGQYVTIPMTDYVDSLNTGIAASVILYELRKKLLHESLNKK